MNKKVISITRFEQSNIRVSSKFCRQNYHKLTALKTFDTPIVADLVKSFLADDLAPLFMRQIAEIN